MTTLAVMQPTYLPWLGYFDLMDQVDELVLLDSVQFSYQSWQHRNRIVKSGGGLEWLTVPVKSRGRMHKRIDEIELSERPFADEHIRRMRDAYDGAPFGSMLRPIYDVLARSAASAHRLSEVTIPLLEELSAALGIDTPLVRASDLAVEGRRTELLRAICGHRGASTYLSPRGALQYLESDRAVLETAGIEVLVQCYDHPEYPQHGTRKFTGFASTVDLIANAGPDSTAVVRSGRRPAQTLSAALDEERTR